ncbi:MAG: hemolysin [Crocinitomicaceae bacterium]|nr:hemolysin [Crocinitomicaceae bacterium]
MSTIVVILLSLAFSAFFSGIEMAFVSANKLKIELDKKLGSWPAKIYSYFLQNESRFITAMLMGNNIALVIYGIKMGDLLEPQLKAIISNDVLLLLVQTIVSTLIILVTAEFFPKITFRINPNKTLSFFAIPVVLIYGLLYFFVSITLWISEVLIKYVLRVETDNSSVAFNLVDLDHYVKEATAEKDQEELDSEIQIFQNALDFGSVKARECMVPRTEIVAMDMDTPIEQLRDKFIERGLSKILIYRDNIDNIIGYTHSFELFKKPDAITKILLPISIIPESMAANEVLQLLIKQKRTIAVVVDEFGGTAGLLTVEDVVEEIFGDIEDEHDKDELTEEEIKTGEYRFAARLEVDYINEQYDLDLPESEEYETLAGLIINLYESIPSEGELISTDQFVFTIEKVSDKRIECVHVKVKTIED